MVKPIESSADMVKKRFNLDLDKDDEDWIIKQIEEHVADAVKEEREACAKAIEGFKIGGPTKDHVIYIGEGLAELIRQRGK